MTVERTSLNRDPARDAITFARSPRRLPAAPERILVGMLLPIGDTLLATPALAALRARFPAANVTAMVHASNAGILQGNPDITRTLVVPPLSVGKAARRFPTALRAIRALHPDLIINLSGAASIVTRVALPTTPRLFLDIPPLWWLTGADADYRRRHALEHYLYALKPLGVALPSRAEAVPRLYLTDDDREAARASLQARGIPANSPFIAMHVGGEGFNGRKRWAPARFAAVANALVERYDASVILIGGKADVPLSEETAAAITRNGHVLAGQSSLKATAALIERATLFIGNDSAPLHIAAATNTPAIGIFGPSDWEEFSPVGRPDYQGRIVHSDLPCSPCFRFVGNDPLWKVNPCFSYACLKAITPQRVIETAVELLGADPVVRVPSSAPATEPPRH